MPSRTGDSGLPCQAGLETLSSSWSLLCRPEQDSSSKRQRTPLSLSTAVTSAALEQSAGKLRVLSVGQNGSPQFNQSNADTCNIKASLVSKLESMDHRFFKVKGASTEVLSHRQRTVQGLEYRARYHTKCAALATGTVLYAAATATTARMLLQLLSDRRHAHIESGDSFIVGQ